MDNLTDKEILKASDAIDKAFAAMTKQNRGETAQRILSFARNLNDNIAEKIWDDTNPTQKMSVNKAAGKLNGKYYFIHRFDTFLQAAVSHFTPSEDGSERLLIKYYKYLLQLKKLMYDNYGIEILKNINCFVDNTDEQTEEYYKKVSASIQRLTASSKKTEFDNFYIDKVKPFYVDNEIYYEITLEPATGKSNKFQRITAFTHFDIFSNYSVALSFTDTVISVFGTSYPIKIIVDWKVSIRPCEFDNFAWLIGIETNTRRSNNDYRAMMDIITRTHLSLVDIIDLQKAEYAIVKQELLSGIRSNISPILSILNKCRQISQYNMQGKNIVRYLLLHINNVILRDQRPTVYHPNKYGDFNMSSKCMPFDLQPYAFHPRGHIASLYDLYQCIDAAGHRAELLKRFLEHITIMFYLPLLKN